MKSTSIILVVFCLLFAASAFAITDEEIFRAFSINLSTPGARAVGMGGAFIGRADDATAAETNPAGLTILARPEISLEYQHAGSRNVNTSVVRVPITDLDITPTPNPPVITSGLANFSANDELKSVDELGFASIVYPFSAATIAFSRHELIHSDARLVGGITASPFHFTEQNDFLGSANIEDVNYGISGATKVGDFLSIGATVKISDFTFHSDIGARQKAETVFGQHFSSRIHTDDQKVGFNAGILVHPSKEVSFGLVYKYEPRFKLDVAVVNADFPGNPLIISKAGLTTVNFDVPDQIGFGVSAAPNSNWTFNFDVVRIFYSELEPVQTGYSLFTHLLPITNSANQINFKINDGTDVHAGAEYLIPHENLVFALRGGWYRQTRNRFFLGSAANVNVKNFLEPIFGTSPGKAFNHLTVGTGVTYRNNFQLDFALDWARDQTIDSDLEQLTHKDELAEGGVNLVLSSVVRF